MFINDYALFINDLSRTDTYMNQINDMYYIAMMRTQIGVLLPVESINSRIPCGILLYIMTRFRGRVHKYIRAGLESVV